MKKILELELKYKIKIISINGYREKVNFNCLIHGYQYKRLDHLISEGCSLCVKEEKLKIKELKFISKSNRIHNYKYDYTLVDYKHSKSPVKIVCKEHGIFEQLPNFHLNGSRCPFCNYKNHPIDIKNKLNDIYPNLKISINENTDVRIKSIIECECKEHGKFKKELRLLLGGHGCYGCSPKSKGEESIRSFLCDNNIKFEREKSFESCKSLVKLRFDFYLPDIKTLIEYNGKQHYESVEFFGGDESLNLIKLRDNIKEKWADDNNFKLIIIKYDESIEDRLIKEFWSTK